MSLIYLVMTSLMVIPNGFNITDSVVGINPNSIYAFGSGIFVNYVWSFELLSLILTIIVVGLINSNSVPLTSS